MGFVFILLVAVATARFVAEPKAHAKNGWIKSRRALPFAKLTVDFALSRDVSSLTEELYAVSMPSSPRYGQLYTREQVMAATKPSEATLKAFESFAQKNRLQCRLRAGHSDWMTCANVPVPKLERLLQTRFHQYTHPLSKEVLTRAERYSLPAELEGHVDLVAGVKRLPDMRQVARKVRARGPAAGGVTPQRSRELWHVGQTQGNKTNGQRQAVVQFLKQYFSLDDLHQFWSALGLPSDVSVTLTGPEGEPGDEAMLDLETITGINQGTPTLGASNPGLGPDKQEPFLTWLLNVAKEPQPALVHSVSYGDVESSIDAIYLARVDSEFVKLGLLGHTFVFSSGDSGVGCNANGSRQEPDFPASSPHVLSVGGSVDNGSAAPVSWNGAGGGFSNFFPDPAFMQATHQEYLNESPSAPPAHWYNATGRGYPDVSAIAWDVVIVVGGQQGLVGGTSCASPAISALLSMLNDVRIAQNKSPLGYVTPLMYNVTYDAFVAVNAGPANSNGNCPGFTPRPTGGWTPSVGFGGLNFAKLSALVASLP